MYLEFGLCLEHHFMINTSWTCTWHSNIGNISSFYYLFLWPFTFIVKRNQIIYFWESLHKFSLPISHQTHQYSSIVTPILCIISLFQFPFTWFPAPTILFISILPSLVDIFKNTAMSHSLFLFDYEIINKLFCNNYIHLYLFNSYYTGYRSFILCKKNNTPKLDGIRDAPLYSLTPQCLQQ